VSREYATVGRVVAGVAGVSGARDVVRAADKAAGVLVVAAGESGGAVAGRGGTAGRGAGRAGDACDGLALRPLPLGGWSESLTADYPL
jgi:hypothetical protein